MIVTRRTRAAHNPNADGPLAQTAPAVQTDQEHDRLAARRAVDMTKRTVSPRRARLIKRMPARSLKRREAEAWAYVYQHTGDLMSLLLGGGLSTWLHMSIPQTLGSGVKLAHDLREAIEHRDRYARARFDTISIEQPDAMLSVNDPAWKAPEARPWIVRFATGLRDSFVDFIDAIRDTFY